MQGFRLLGFMVLELWRRHTQTFICIEFSYGAFNKKNNDVLHSMELWMTTYEGKSEGNYINDDLDFADKDLHECSIVRPTQTTVFYKQSCIKVPSFKNLTFHSIFKINTTKIWTYIWNVFLYPHNCLFVQFIGTQAAIILMNEC